MMDDLKLPLPNRYCYSDEGFECYTADQMREFAKQAVEVERAACLNCYSPDDTATDWADKIRARSEA